MSDTQKEEFDFIKEKIKSKPINKKRIVKQVIKTAGLGVIFGVTACLAFTLLQPVLKSALEEPEDQAFVIPRDDEDPDTETETETEQQPMETETEGEDTQEPNTQIIEVPRDLELEDYQELQNKLYAVGIQANKSIVTVTGVKSDTDWFNSSYETAGLASGIIIAKNGQELLVMTEKKVIADAEAISVTFQNGSVADAVLKKYDGNTGIAILSVPLQGLDELVANNVQAAELGNSYRVAQGDVVIAVGSPLGSNYSILTGNITSINNAVSTIDSSFTVFTTDIVGSSKGSGALLNLQGQIVGLVMQDYSSQGDENTLTALSISELKEIIERLSNNQDITYLGLKVSTVTREIEENHGLPRGVYIKSVEMDSPALAAGLQNGDVIISINDQEILTVDQYEQYVRKLEPGALVRIVIMRQGLDGFTEITCQAEAGILR
jgi:serine protease Do